VLHAARIVAELGVDLSICNFCQFSSKPLNKAEHRLSYKMDTGIKVNEQQKLTYFAFQLMICVQVLASQLGNGG
jgi:hypothetical protein